MSEKEVKLEELPFGDANFVMLLRCGKPNRPASASMIRNVAVNIREAANNGGIAFIPADFDLLVANKLDGSVKMY